MFEMIIYISYLGLSRNNRRLQEFQSTFHQGIIRIVASTAAGVTNMHGRNPEAQKPSFIFNVFTAFKTSKFHFSKLKCSYILKIPNKAICFLPKYPIMLSFFLFMIMYYLNI